MTLDFKLIHYRADGAARRPYPAKFRSTNGKAGNILKIMKEIAPHFATKNNFRPH
jgi:hypothetical protein